MRPARSTAHASASAAAARRWSRSLQWACVLGLAGHALAGQAQDANGTADADDASTAAAPADNTDRPATDGALAAAWRQGGVPQNLQRGPAPELARLDTTATVQRPVPGTTLQSGDRAEISSLSYRWWTSRGAADIGFGLGSVGYVVRPSGATALPDGAPMLASTSTGVSVGVRYHANERSVVYADALAAPGFDRGDAYFTKVGVEWKAARSPLSLVHGGVGFQLDNSSRMTFRPRRGGLGVYLRSQF